MLTMSSSPSTFNTNTMETITSSSTTASAAATTTSNINNNHNHPLINLPCPILYTILTYIDKPIYHPKLVCFTFQLLCHLFHNYINVNDDLWEMILIGYYKNDNDSKNKKNHGTSTQGRRLSKRLRRNTAKEDVIHAHFVLRDQVSLHY